MNDDMFYELGEPIPLNELTKPFLTGLVPAVSRYPFAALVGARRFDRWEGVVVDFAVERPQDAPVLIQYQERLLILQPDATEAPSVLALRKDFPDTDHRNLTPPGDPKSLCLFEAPFEEVRAGLTPMLYLRRISDWLKRAAVEALHAQDQPLETLLPVQDRIIFDPKYFDGQSDQTSPVTLATLSRKPLILRAIPAEAIAQHVPVKAQFVVLSITAPPWHATSLRHLPHTLAQLVEVLRSISVDLEAELRNFIRRLEASRDFTKYESFQVVILLRLPKARNPESEPETIEWWSFWTAATLADLAIHLGLADRHDGKVGFLLGPPTSTGLDQLQIGVLRPTYAFSRDFAQVLAAMPPRPPSKIVAIGAGSLGSHVILALARQGFGRWAIVDDDHLLPHNHERHVLSPHFEGQSKSIALALEIQTLLNDPNAAVAFPVSFRPLAALSEALAKELQAAEFILDLSTSRGVLRGLAKADYPGQRLTAFLSPEARFIAVLSEGRQRTVRLDDLEMQFAMALHEILSLRSFYAAVAGTVSYANYCRDVSARLPYEPVMTAAAIASRYVKSAFAAEDAEIRVWEQHDTGAVSLHKVPIFLTRIVEVGGWTLRVSAHVAEQLQTYRSQRLPSETGGILLGRIDTEAQVIYIVGALPAPPDSVEWPTLYIRGSSGLSECVATIRQETGSDVTYVGEWHSHPDGCDVTPSSTDHEAHAWLAEQMGYDGLPAVIAIQGESAQPAFYIRQSRSEDGFSTPSP